MDFNRHTLQSPLFLILLGALLYWLLEQKGLSFLAACCKPLAYAALCIYLLEPAVASLSRRFRLSRVGALLLTFALLALTLFFLLYLLLPDLTRAVLSLADLLAKTSLASHLPLLLENAAPLLERAGSLVENISTLLATLLMSFYFLLTHESLGESLAAFLYPLCGRRADRPLLILHLLSQSCRRFLGRKLLLAFLQGVLLFLSTQGANLLFHLHIPSPLLLGLLTFLGNLIPLFGPIAAALLCGVLAYLAGLPELIVTLCLTALFQQLDNLILSPRLLGSGAGLSPFSTLAALSVAASTGSLTLILLAVPLAAFGQTLFRAWRANFNGYRLPDRWLRYRP